MLRGSLGKLHQLGKGATLVRGALATAVAVALAASATGCGTLRKDFNAYQDGWRSADVLEVGSAVELRGSGFTDCRRSATPYELKLSRFAVLSYRATGRRHLHVVILDDASDIRAGDIVYTNVLRCGTPVERRARL